MDVQFWIWVAIVVITFLARAMKKKGGDAQPSDPFPTSTSDDRESNKPMTFEDLLREIQANKEPAPPPPAAKTYVPTWKSDVVDYDDDIQPEEKPLETVRADYRKDDGVYEVYEKAKKEAFSRPSLEETVKLEDTVIRFGKFKGYQKNDQKRGISQYLNDFQDKEGFKKAFIMSEILKRRF